MKHIEEHRLKAYVDDALVDVERLEVEAHMDQCEACFEHYLTIVDAWSLEPSLSEDFTDQTFDQILKQQSLQATDQAKQEKPVRKRKQNKTFVHYAVAAGLTILLMFGGVFDFMMERFNEDSIKQKPSISKDIAEKTGKLLEFEKKLKGEQ